MIQSHARRALVLLVTIVSGATGLLAPGQASAYVRTLTDEAHPMYWETSCLFIKAYAENPPDNLEAGQFLAAARAAAGVWSNDTLACSGLQLVVSEISGEEGDVAYDNRNLIMFRHKTWCKQPFDPRDPGCYPSEALAITSVFAEKKTGLIKDADMEVNGVDFQWADVTAGGDAAMNAHDLQNTLTHEFGHVIGLDHTCRGMSEVNKTDNTGARVPLCMKEASSEILATTMVALVTLGDTARRTLEPDDQKAVCEIYPARKTLICVEPTEVASPSSGGCAIGRGASRGFNYWILALVLGASAIGRRLLGSRKGQVAQQPFVPRHK